MPTVRELKNRITFDVDKATVTNAENTFKKLKGGAKVVISTVKAVGLAITALVAASAKQFIDLEKDIGATNFFSRSKEDAEELLALTKDIARVSLTTSQKEAGQASALLSQIPGIERFRKELLPILEEISVANPKLDFTGVTEAFTRLAKDGNLDELKNLIPGSAELLEKLALSTFNFADRTKTAANRTELFLQQISKVRPELKRLADEQRETLAFQGVGISKETSDFFSNFGRSTAGPMAELFKEIRLTIRELNSNEAFWIAVESSAKGVAEAFKTTKKVISEINEKGLLGFFTEGEGTKDAQERYKEDPEKFIENFTGKKTPFDINKILPDFFKIRETQGLQGGAGIQKESEAILQGEKPARLSFL